MNVPTFVGALSRTDFRCQETPLNHSRDTLVKKSPKYRRETGFTRHFSSEIQVGFSFACYSLPHSFSDGRSFWIVSCMLH